jgi:putative transposase
MSQATSAGTGKSYGLQRVCRVLDFPRSTIYAQHAAAKVVPLRPQRRGPNPKGVDADLLTAIRVDLAALLLTSR